MKKISILSFAKEIIPFISFGNTKLINWGQDNLFPQELINYYENVPANSSSIDFTESLIVGQGLNTDKLDYWTVKKLIGDYLIFGGYAIEVIKLRNGNVLYNYVDISKLRYNEGATKILYCEDWSSYKQTIIKNDISDGKTNGIYIFKNFKSKGLYPKPNYMSLIDVFATYKSIIEYHRNNSENGFSPSYHINVIGVSDDDERDELEKSLLAKFTKNGQKFLLSFSNSDVDGITVNKIDGNDDDKKFTEIITFLREEIFVGHKITSSSLIGINNNTGFSKSEYEESLGVFKENIIEGYRNELLYSFEELTGITDLMFIDKEEKNDVEVQDTVDNNKVEDETKIDDISNK